MVPIIGTNLGTSVGTNVGTNVQLTKRCQMSNYQTPGLWRRFTQKKIDIMRFTHIDVNFDFTYQGHQNWLKILSIDISSVFGYHHM